MAILALYLLAAVLAFPLTLPIMLFLGNIGLHVGYWGVYPGAIALIASRSSITTK